jgi:hypothetical protein
MAKQYEKDIAQNMRRRGASISHIAKKLKVSKSTVSIWCKDITLSPSQIEHIAQTSKHHATLALLMASEKQRAVRMQNTNLATQKGKESVGTLTKRDIFMVGLGLYWGEGYKKGSQEFGFTNSDSAMILFYIEWLRSVFNIKTEDMILRVSINALHAHRINDVESYWSHLTGIPKTQFTKTSLIKTTSKKVYKNTEEHFGTLRIKVRRGTDLRRQVLGAISALSK